MWRKIQPISGSDLLQEMISGRGLLSGLAANQQRSWSRATIHPATFFLLCRVFFFVAHEVQHMPVRWCITTILFRCHS
jgi:hypothetical protein